MSLSDRMKEVLVAFYRGNQNEMRRSYPQLVLTVRALKRRGLLRETTKIVEGPSRKVTVLTDEGFDKARRLSKDISHGKNPFV